jgi:hypothetical protein
MKSTALFLKCPHPRKEFYLAANPRVLLCLAMANIFLSILCTADVPLKMWGVNTNGVWVIILHITCTKWGSTSFRIKRELVSVQLSYAWRNKNTRGTWSTNTRTVRFEVTCDDLGVEETYVLDMILRNTSLSCTIITTYSSYLHGSLKNSSSSIRNILYAVCASQSTPANLGEACYRSSRW